MFYLGPQRLMRGALVTLPRIVTIASCRAVSSANSNCTKSCALSNPLSSGLSIRTFSTSPVCLAGPLHTSDLLLQKNFGRPRRHTGRPPQQQQQRQLRLHGTVTAFKHRRGYGFVLAEGVVPNSHKTVYMSLEALQRRSLGDDTAPTTTAAATATTTVDEAASAAGEDATTMPTDEHEDMLHKSYFFTRSGLEGGFYVTEGERVSFSVSEIQPDLGTSRYLGAPAFHSAAGRAGAAAAALAEEFSLDPAEESHSGSGDNSAAAAPHKVRAEALRLYDQRTNVESPVTPITLYGKVVEWDDAKGEGVIAELDTERQFHDDAPRFPVSVEDLDLGSGTRMHAGRFVRFCLSPASASKSGDAAEAAVTPTGEGALVAQRVIIDITMERRRGAFGRPLVPATAQPGTVSDQTRFHGVVREIRAGRFGFVIDDLSGESIFFHAVNARANVREGDRVTYLLREIIQGKHAGKKACFDVSRAPGKGGARRDESAHRAAEEDDIDLLEEEEGNRRVAATRKPESSEAGKTTKKAAAAAAPREVEEIDFVLLH